MSDVFVCFFSLVCMDDSFGSNNRLDLYARDLEDLLEGKKSLDRSSAM